MTAPDTSIAVWPHRRTLRLKLWTLRLWLIGGALVLANALLIATAQFETLKPGTMPATTKALIGTVLSMVVGSVLTSMLKTGLVLRRCEALIRPLIAEVINPQLRKTLEDDEPKRLRGVAAAWADTMDILCRHVTASRVEPEFARANDAAQRLSPPLLAALLLCVAAVSSPWWWSGMQAAVGLGGWQVVMAMICTWLLAALVLGGVASLPVGQWLR